MARVPGDEGEALASETSGMTVILRSQGHDRPRRQRIAGIQMHRQDEVPTLRLARRPYTDP
ncbi:hypothetical protein ASG43_09470 [Aureimonas sp. Leaf454]|nr:hypothetical protein ASG43_09470 [Aureimonas sp. Leaf454]